MTEPAHLAMTRAAYDTVAADYAELLRDNLASMPFDRAMLDVFAELVQRDGGGRVGDLGCGPGRVAAYLAQLGVEAFGIDLSPRMIEVARRTYPGLRFDEGSLAALDLPSGDLAGAVAWYSVIHTPPDALPTVFAELHRVLRPGGRLLLAFQVGDKRVHHRHAYGHDISLHGYRLDPERIAAQLSQRGFVVTATLVRQPEAAEKTPQAYLLAGKPA